MKTNEDRMIDFVAKSYEENRFDPKKALARSQNGSLRRSLSLSKCPKSEYKKGIA